MAWTEQDYQEIVARLMASSIGVNEVPNADKADDVTSLPAFKPSGSDSEASVVNYPLEFLKGEQGEPGIQGEPGKSFKVAGEYATLEALKSAVPDGSAVDGFMAVGTEAPYDYYAWVSSAGGNNPNPSPDGKYLLLSDGTPLLLANEEPILLADSGERVASNGEWVSQGKIGGMDEAPTDGKAYGRKNGDWAEVSDKKYVDDSISSARSVGYMMQRTEIDASGLDENTWYPVTIAAGERMNIRVEVLVSLDSGTKPSWSQHDRGFSVRKIWEFAPYAWGVNSKAISTVYLSDFNLADIDPVRGLSNLTNHDTCYVFVRGGGKYHFYASHEAKVILHTDTYAPSDQSVSPTTETPAAIVENIATKEYVDSYHYGKSLKIPNVETVLHPTSLQGQDAQSKIDELFGGAESFKAIVEDILTKHTRYYFHFDDNFTNCLELGCVNAWRSNKRTSYELHFIVVYNTNNIYYTSRIGVIYNVDVNATKYYVAHLVQSDNLTTLTKKTAAEYEAIGSKDDNTAYCVTD